MGTRQIYRGDPTQKLYYVTNDFSGGINTRDVDENIYDNQFRDLINVNINTQGIIQSRKGFTELKVINDILPEGIQNPQYIKILKNENNAINKLIDEIIDLSMGWINVNEEDILIDGSDFTITEYELIDGGTFLTTVDETIESGLFTNVTYIIIPSKPTAGYTAALPKEDALLYDIVLIYDVNEDDYIYYEMQHIFEDFKMLIIDNNLLKLVSYDTSLEVKALTLTDLDTYGTLPEVDSYRDNIKLMNVVEDINNIYMSLNDISPYYKGILVYNRDDDTWKVLQGEYLLNGNWTKMDSDLQLTPYKPKPYDIQSSSSGLTQGFNVLADEPLLYINDQGTGFPSLRSIIVTNSEGGYVDKIPSNGEFIVNVVKTGTFAPENLQFKFRDQNDNYIDFIIGYYDEITGDITNYGIDNGGYISYQIDLGDLTGVDYILMDVLWQNKVLTPDGGTYFRANNTYYAVEDEYFIYLKNTDTSGTELSQYTKTPVDYRMIVTDVDLQEPSDLGIFDIYMTADFDQKIFQFISENKHRTFKYTHTTPATTFTELATDNILYKNWEYIIPLTGAITDWNISGSTYYVLYSNVLSNGDSVVKTEIDLNSVVPGIEGQYFDISDASPEEPIEGLDLEKIKLIKIDNKMVYYGGNTIYFSALYQFDYIPNFAFVILPLLSTDEIVKIKYFKSSWIIFTKYTIWKMKGTYGDADWSVTLLNDSIGCIAPNTVVSLENSLYFLSQNGLYRLIQNYYQEGLENVAKADKLIPGLIPIDNEIQGILYRDQYILYMPDEYDFDTIRMYYNIDLADKQKPFVKDIFAVRPSNLFVDSGNLFSIKNGYFYVYDEGYTDFLPIDAEVSDDYLYNVVIETSALNFGYPTHDKKIKSIYVKTKADAPTYLYFTVWLDGYLRIEPTSFRAVLNENEEIVYEEYIDYTKESNIKLKLDELGELELGDGILGDNENAVHKITLGHKGKTIKIKIEQQSDANFGITNIGYLYKLGKVKEQR